jgi:hypothetical protein
MLHPAEIAIFRNCPVNPKFHFVSKTGVISTKIVGAFSEVYTLEMANQGTEITTILNLYNTITKIKRL